MSDGSDIDYMGNEFGSNFESSSVSISSESDLDERHVQRCCACEVVCNLSLQPENDVSIWIQNLYDDSNFLGFHGSWVERDFNQLVTAAFQGICEENSGRECVGLQLLQPVLASALPKCVVLLE